MKELIWKQDALDAFNVDMSGISVTISGRGAGKVFGYIKTVTDRIKAMPPVQPTITHEQAIDYLHETGWLQEHDRILTESKIAPPVQLETPNNQTHLCAGCNYVYPECPASEADVVFGNGKGGDNICMCACFKPKEPKRGKWILDRSGAYCCSECMEPCAGYVMMQPRDKFCKMCGSRNEVTE